MLALVFLLNGITQLDPNLGTQFRWDHTSLRFVVGFVWILLPFCSCFAVSCYKSNLTWCTCKVVFHMADSCQYRRDESPSLQKVISSTTTGTLYSASQTGFILKIQVCKLRTKIIFLQRFFFSPVVCHSVFCLCKPLRYKVMGQEVYRKDIGTLIQFFRCSLNINNHKDKLLRSSNSDTAEMKQQLTLQ